MVLCFLGRNTRIRFWSELHFDDRRFGGILAGVNRCGLLLGVSAVIFCVGAFDETARIAVLHVKTDRATEFEEAVLSTIDKTLAAIARKRRH